VVQMWPLPTTGGYPEALRDRYRFIGSCRLGTFQGPYNVFLAAPVGLPAGSSRRPTCAAPRGPPAP